MRPGALEPYERALRDGSPLTLVSAGGSAAGGAGTLPLDIGRFAGPVDAADRSVLDRARPPVLDVGCGPGRLVAELSGRGVPALGIDVSASAVRMARDRGAQAVQAGIFGPVPDVGRWGSVLLLDGNVGIDGDPPAVLRRCAELITDDGEILVETATSRGPAGPFRFADRAGVHEPSFGWSVVTDDGLADLAGLVGLTFLARWRHGARSFSALRRPPSDGPAPWRR